MPTRLVHEATGTDRELPDDLAAMHLKNPESGWSLPPQKTKKKTDPDTVETPGE